MKKVDIKTLIVLAIIFLIALFSIKSHEDKKYQQLTGKYELLQKQYAIKEERVQKLEEDRKKERDSLNILIKNREIENQKLIISNVNLEKRIKQLETKKILIPTDAPGLSEYFNDRYATEENKPIENKIGLGLNTAYNVSYELEEKDIFSEVIVLKNSQINNKDTLIFNLEKNTEDLTKMFLTAEQELIERKKLQNIANENIEVLGKQIKSLNKNKKLNRILIPAAALVGGFVGYQIAK